MVLVTFMLFFGHTKNSVNNCILDNFFYRCELDVLVRKRMAVAKWLVFKLTLVGKELCNTKKCYLG